MAVTSPMVNGTVLKGGKTSVTGESSKINSTSGATTSDGGDAAGNGDEITPKPSARKGRQSSPMCEEMTSEENDDPSSFYSFSHSQVWSLTNFLHKMISLVQKAWRSTL